MSYSTARVSTQLLDEIKSALHSIHFGSVEIYIQDKKVTQITVRNIKKTRLEIDQNNRKSSSKGDRKDSALSHKIEVLTMNE